MATKTLEETMDEAQCVLYRARCNSAARAGLYYSAELERSAR